MTTKMKLEARTEDGLADAHFVYPDGEGPWPGVILFMDALGPRRAMVEIAERFAAGGYCVLVPNLFYRAGSFAPFNPITVWSDHDERNRLMDLVKALDVASAMRDVKGYIDALEAERQVIPGKVGCVGYCLGGRLAFLGAASYPDRVAAAASIHGGGLVTDDPESPHKKAHLVRASLYFGIADEDNGATPTQQAALVSALSNAHLDYQFELYSRRSHGFAVHDVPVFDAAACERHYARVLDLFDRALPRA